MSFTLARISFYLVAFFVAMVFVKMLIDKAQEMKMKGFFSKKDDKDKEDPLQ